MSQPILFRALRRLTSLEAKSVQQFVEQERFDVELSVYEVMPEEVTRATAEHAASFVDSPGRRVGIAVSAPESVETRREVGETNFEFTRSVHRSLIFFDVEELHALVHAILPDLTAHARHTSKSELGVYIASRVDARDPEWCDMLAREDRSEWSKLARRHQTQTALEPLVQVPSK